MKNVQLVVSAAALAAVAGTAFAGGVLNSGASSLLIGASTGAVPFTAPNGEGNLILDGALNAAGSFNAGDVLQRNLWFARGGGTSTSGTVGSRIFSSVNTPTESYTGNTATLTYTNFSFTAAALQPSADITFTVTLADLPGTGTARYDTVVAIRNRSTSQSLRAQIFNLFAPNLQNASGTNGVSNDTASFVGNDPLNQLFAETAGGTSEGRVASFRAFGDGAVRGANGQNRSTGVLSYFPTSSSAAGPISVLNNTSGGATNLNPPSVFGVAGALQWDINVAPGATQYIHSAVAYGIGSIDAIPTPGAAALLGIGGLVAARRRRA